MSKKISEMSTEEKFLAAKKAKEAGKYKTVEDAARAFKISPATYYIYNKTHSNDQAEDTSAKIKVVDTSEPPKAGIEDAGTDNYSDAEINRIIKENQELRVIAHKNRTMAEQLQDQVQKLKEKIVDLVMVKG